MLKKQNRLPADESFSGERIFSSPFFLAKLKKNSLKDPRFGFVVSKRVEKRAVARNRLKRLLSNTVQEEFLNDAGYDMLIIIKKPFSDAKAVRPELMRIVKEYKNEKNRH